MPCSYLIVTIMILVSFNSHKDSECLAEDMIVKGTPLFNNHTQIKQNVYKHFTGQLDTFDRKMNKNISTAHINDKRCSNDSECVPWAFCNVSSCVCRETLENEHILKCGTNTLELSVIKGYCVTYDNSTGHMSIGMCIENCETNYGRRYIPLPTSPSAINQFMCIDKWNRTGRLCGKCLPGFSPLVYSFDMRCVECPEGNGNIWKFILAAFGPLTIFYFFVLFFKINATSSQLHGYLIFSQGISMPAFVRHLVIYWTSYPDSKIILQILISLYSMWNLDILRSVYPDICLDASMLTVLALDYTLAIYPLMLNVLSYILIELHAHNYRIIVFIWKPFRSVFTLFRRNWDTRTTVIDAYATFFLISFVKVLSVSFDLLIPTRVYDMQSGNITWVLYYDGTIDYFGTEHLPYAILALTFCLFFAVFPTLLLILYPFRWFQRVLIFFKMQREGLKALMLSFQGCYKDGTDGSKDCRWFAAVPLIGRFVLFITYAYTIDSIYFPMGAGIIIIIMIFTTAVQPYKNMFAHYTKIDVAFWGLLAFFYCMVETGNYSSSKTKTQILMGNIFRFTAPIIPLIYMTGITIYWIVFRMKKIKEFIRRVQAWRRDYQQLEDAELPHRIPHPEIYQNLQEPESNNSPQDYSQDNDTY